MLTELLLLDIETVPQSASFSGLEPAWQSLFCDKISKTVPEGTDPEEIYRAKAGIFAEFGRIVCISTAFLYQSPAKKWSLRIKSFAGDDEVQILRDFTELCYKMQQQNPQFQFAGHNIKEFDIPFICRRLLINGLPLPPCLQLHDKKPWEVRMFDTLNWWKFGDHKNYISLHLLASVLGVPTSKSDMDGSMVQDVYYKEKNLPRITSYCERDVIATANVILRFHALPLLEEDCIVVV